MHEMAICESLVQIMEEQARVKNFGQVRTVWLEIGQLAGVELEALRFGFDVVTRGTLAEGARLEIEEMPGRAWCLRCARSVPAARRFDACPECGSYQLQVTGGDEMRIKELEVN